MPKERRLEASVLLPRPRDEVFPFFSNAENLNVLTPSNLGFDILTPRPIKMHQGAIIDYRVRIMGVPVRWRTLISVWEPPYRFVDEQTKGPYALWVHEHTFEDTPEGTLCKDVVRYAHWGGPIGESLFVRPQLDAIFAFRAKKLMELFPRKDTAR